MNIFHVTLLALAMTTLPAAALAQEAKTSFKFDFGPGSAQDGYTSVTPDTLFTPDRGYGFDLNTKPASAARTGDEPLRGDFVTGDTPFYFSVALPEGTYKVTLTLGDAAAESTTTVKAEAHRLMLERVHTRPGEFQVHSFHVNIRTPKMSPPVPNNAPGRNEVTLSLFEQRNDGGLTWDDKLTLEFLGSRPRLCALEIEKADDVPVIYLAGDSTVTDQQGNTTTSWGQMITRFFKPEVAVANYAESGETMKSFITALRLDKLLSRMKPGDYLLIQFGHNDSKANWPQTYAEANTTYKAYLKVFIAEARRRGAIPVLISSMERRSGANGNTHGDYPQAVRQVAQEENVAFIDLHSMSKTLYQALGQNVGQAFNDGTHHSRYGAYELAKCIVQGIRDNNLDLAKHISDDFTGFDPARPDPFETFAVPPSAGPTPRGQIIGS